MPVDIRFNLDTNKHSEKSEITIRSPYSELKATRDNLNTRLDNSGKALMPVRDAESGDFVFVNTMKIASIDIYEVGEE